MSTSLGNAQTKLSKEKELKRENKIQPSYLASGLSTNETKKIGTSSQIQTKKAHAWVSLAYSLYQSRSNTPCRALTTCSFQNKVKLH
jgi:hypothetical protein